MPISDLTGTKWVFNSNIYTTLISLPYPLINFTSNGNSYVQMYLNDSDQVLWYYTIANDTSNRTKVYDAGDWTNDAYKTISITGGTDATNASFIAWLQANATQIVANAYELTHDLTDLSHGNVSFTIAPDAGYALPSSVTVSNGTLVSYDSTTGVIVVSGESAEISVDCEAASVGYSGNITTFNSFQFDAPGTTTETAIKFDAPPTSRTNYDACVDYNGNLTGLTSFQNKTKVYVWGLHMSSYGKVRINNIIYDGDNRDYYSAVEVPLTGNYNIELGYATSGGGND